MELEHLYYNLKRKVDHYKELRENTLLYRKQWKEGVKDLIISTLNKICQDVGLDAKTEVRSELENLEAIIMTLGDVKSGLFQLISPDLQRDLIKHNGSLVYQQLFNGKIIVLVNYPFIESYGQPRPPKTLSIYRPEELHSPFFVRHVEEMLQEISSWEDYDDDEPMARIGFNMPIGGAKQEGTNISE